MAALEKHLAVLKTLEAAGSTETWTTTNSRAVMSHATLIFIKTAVKTSNLHLLFYASVNRRRLKSSVRCDVTAALIIIIIIIIIICLVVGGCGCGGGGWG
jgi:hypothetical protein